MQTHVHEFTALADTGRYPAFARALAELSDGFDLDMDALFELGLRSLLDGFAASIALTQVPPKTSARSIET